MAGKVGNSAESESNRGASLLVEAEPPRPAAEVRPLRIILSGTVVVEFDVAVPEGDGLARHVVVRVEFPDEVRSMLEQSTWTRGTTIHEAVSRLGAAFLERNGLGDLAASTGATPRRPPTYHLPLSYVRSSLASVCASSA
jgi:hypothetical protein